MKKRGFTMVEISIAMSFIATLLITIAVVINQLTAIYQKGLALRSVNSVGRELVDEFTRGIQLAPIKGVKYLCSGHYSSSNEEARTRCINSNAELLTYYERYATIDGQSVPVNGAFCTGRYSYVWNTGYAIKNPGDNNFNKAEVVIPSIGYDSDDFHLLRIPDDNREVCSTNVSGSTYSYVPDDNKVVYNLSNFLDESNSPIELLSNSEESLVLYDFVSFPSATHNITQHSFYSLTFILGTLQGGVDVMSVGDYCKDVPGLNLSTDFNYCAVNKFNFSVRATGELNSDERTERGHY